MKLIIQITGFMLITVNNINATLLLLIIKYPKTRVSNPTKAMKRNNASGGSELTVTDKETTINNIEEDTLKMQKLKGLSSVIRKRLGVWTIQVVNRNE